MRYTTTEMTTVDDLIALKRLQYDAEGAETVYESATKLLANHSSIAIKLGVEYTQRSLQIHGGLRVQNSEKYKDEDAYQNHLSEYGGYANAYTQFEWTNF